MFEEKKRFLGKHFLIELFDCNHEKLNDCVFVRRALKCAAKKARSTIVKTVTHNFSPYGASGVVVIAESHISIHTWPEHNYVAADIFTCGKYANPQAAAEVLVEMFEAERHRVRRLRRGLFGPNAIRSKDT